MSLNEDGVWRNKPEHFDGLNESGVFLPKDVSDQQKQIHMRIKHVMDLYGAASHEEFENLWFLSPYRTAIIFDKSFPQFVFEQQTDNDYTNTPWVTMTSPLENPNRQFVFTPPLFDPVPKVWMVSALLPLYLGDRWLGSIGIDLPLENVFTRLLKRQHKYQNAQLFLKDLAGNYILAGDWQNLLESSPEQFVELIKHQSELNELMAMKLTANATVLKDNVSINGIAYAAVGMLLEPMGWHYYKLVPVNDIIEPFHLTLWTLITIILVVSVLSGFLISLSVNKNIGQRIKRLAQALRHYDSGTEHHFNHELTGNDEIALAANEFDLMATRLDQQMAELKEYSDNLKQSEQRLKMALEGVGDGVWEWNIETGVAIFSEHWKQMLGYGEDEFVDSFEQWEAHIHPDDKEQVHKHLTDYIENQISRYAVEFRMRCKDGSWKWILARGVIIQRNIEFKPIRMIGTHTDISAQKEIEQHIRKNSEQLRSMLDHSPVAVRIIDHNHRFLYANKAYIELLDIDASQLNDIEPTDYYENKEEYANVLECLKNEGSVRNKLIQLNVSDGNNKWVLASYMTLNYNDQESILGWFYDITERLQAEQSLRLHASVFDNAWEGIIISDAKNKIITVNHAFSKITGYSADEIVGKNPNILSSGLHDNGFYQKLWSQLDSTGLWHGEITNRKKNGDVFAQSASISAVHDDSGKVTHYVAVFNDITEMKKTEKQLKTMAHYDPLTGLPNRVLLADRLSQNLAQTKRNNKLLLVCFLDLDGFKAVNDLYGHDIGDKLLIKIASFLSDEVRTGDTVARLGGDEFVILLSDINDIDEVDASMVRINELIASPVVIDNVTHHVSASIGVTIFPTDDSDADTLLRHADLAMYEAKQAGRNRYHIFDANLDLEIHRQHQQIERIRTAFNNKEFCLYYQPKVNLETGEVVGMEALIRWQHPEHGLLGPINFLPLIEAHDLIVTIGDWVIDQALSQILQWQITGNSIPVSVNVAARQIQHSDFIDKLDAVLALYPEVSSSLLEMEILETSALETIQTAQIVISTSKLLGVSFALDDFGTGYSSLSYLKRLPAKTLKIDQTFVRDMLVDMEDQAIVEGIVKLAKVFHREVIAEGVETAEHGAKLLELGCRLAQGYGIARPMPAEEVIDWVQNYKKS
ncbi:MAG: EAL domain-containing protein [Gammaproteobacteria bacterium]|nr:EAL domain-containing protein [Gammaproteobacteria bacterium]